LNDCVVILLGTGAIGLCVLLSVELPSNSHLQILVRVPIVIIFIDPWSCP